MKRPELLGLRGLTTLASPGSGKARLAILIYHRVLPERDPLDPDIPDQASFDWQMGLLAEEFHPVSLLEGVRGLVRGSLPPRAVAITFDDGYRDNYSVALPVLEKWGLPATFFIATDYLHGRWMWNDLITETVRRWPNSRMDLTPMGLGNWSLADDGSRRDARLGLINALRYLPFDDRERNVKALWEMLDVSQEPRLMMAPHEVRALAGAGMEIGAHTRSHPILSNLEPGTAREEIAGSRAALEDLVGGPCRLFAYPNGCPGRDYGAEHVRMVRELGFEAAVSTQWGAAGRRTCPYQLPRFTPWNETPKGFYLGLLRNLLRGTGPVASGASGPAVRGSAEDTRSPGH
ncbi:polysaccharide deacetylase family protein [Thiohalorhabdus sp. Cl-TMA]|uniref:Polysaccharide deacetylase family protein n=1 Tax=Thiohalorhabdus methylotrophus TaxID=3242694 RepID=A0ABV4TY09_9GAMM